MNHQECVQTGIHLDTLCGDPRGFVDRNIFSTPTTVGSEGSKGQPAVNHLGFILTSFSVVTEFVIQKKCGIDISAARMNKSIMVFVLEEYGKEVTRIS